MSETHVFMSTNNYEQLVVNEDGLPQDGATVTLTIRNGPSATSPILVGPVWPVTLTPLGGGSGLYRYTPPRDLLLVNKTYYVVSDSLLGGVYAHNEVTVLCVKDSD